MITEAPETSIINPPQLRDLEEKINHLIATRNHLRMENTSLRKKLSRATQERAQLADKNTKATVMLKRILGRLKNELPEPTKD